MKFFLHLIFIIFLLTFNTPISAQVGVGVSYGVGYLLGTPFEGTALGGDITYQLSKRWHTGIGVTSFFSSERQYYKTSTDLDPTVIVSDLDLAIKSLLTADEYRLFEEGMIKLKSKLMKTNYNSIAIKIGYDLAKNEKLGVIFSAGATFTKFDQTYTVYAADSTIDIGPFGTWEAKLYIPVYRAYLDLGWVTTLDVNYKIYKEFTIGFVAESHRFGWSRDGYWFIGGKFAAVIK